MANSIGELINALAGFQNQQPQGPGNPYARIPPVTVPGQIVSETDLGPMAPRAAPAGGLVPSLIAGGRVMPPIAVGDAGGQTVQAYGGQAAPQTLSPAQQVEQYMPHMLLRQLFMGDAAASGQGDPATTVQASNAGETLADTSGTEVSPAEAAANTVQASTQSSGMQGSAQESSGVSQPQAQGSPPEAQAGWNSFIEDNRGALLAFGLQALSGGWGGFGQQLAAAVGAGAETAGRKAAIEDEEARQDDKLAFAASEKAKDRQVDRERIAASLKVAKIRSADSGSAPKSLAEQRIFLSQYNRYVKQMTDNNLLAGEGEELTESQIQAEAERLALEDLTRARATVGNLSVGNGPQSGGTGGSVGTPGGPPQATGGPANGVKTSPSSTSQNAQKQAQTARKYKEGDVVKSTDGSFLQLKRDENNKLGWFKVGAPEK